MIFQQQFSVFIFVVLISFSSSKRFNKCGLARDLKEKYGVTSEDIIATYVCIAEHQSRFDTGIINQGMYYGIFQISEEFWCSSSKNLYETNACNLSCKDLLDDDLEDDLKCVERIIEEHKGISGDGFSSAWPSSGSYCQSLKSTYLDECLNEKKSITSKKTHGSISTIVEGKVYERCELARELKYRHQIPSDDIPTWICIVKHESNFNTSAIGRLNWDGSEDHGLFQISDLYWCNREESRGKGCDISCRDLEDSDITDDVECIKKIHEEHTRLFGDGFQAWTTYSKCKDNLVDQYVTDCFSTDIQYIRPGIQQPTSQTPQTTSFFKTETSTTKTFELNSKTASVNNDENEASTTKTFESTSKRTSIYKSENEIKDQKRTTTKKMSTKARFDIFAFYLSDYNSHSKINYKPIIFGKKGSKLKTFESSKTESPIRKHQIIGNITPHSIEYLLQLTTPKNKI